MPDLPDLITAMVVVTTLGFALSMCILFLGA